MRYYSEETVKKIMAHAAYNGIFCIQEPINLETYSSIELPDKYGSLISKDEVLACISKRKDFAVKVNDEICADLCDLLTVDISGLVEAME